MSKVKPEFLVGKVLVDTCFDLSAPMSLTQRAL